MIDDEKYEEEDEDEYESEEDENENEDEEYQFADIEEEADVYEPAGPELPRVPQQPPIARILITLIIFAGLAYTGYYFIRNYMSEKKPVSKPTVAVKPRIIAQPTVTQPVAPVKPAISEKQFNELTQKVGNLQTLSNSINSDIASLRTRLSAIESTIGDANTKLSDMNESILKLAEQLKPKKAPVRMRKRKRVKRRYVPRTIYHVKAAIPGRAWLQTKAGKSITVVTGSRLAGYGKIKMIDAEKGKVYTTSGAIIRYRNNGAR